MEIKDPVHGSVRILGPEIPIVTHSFFERLRNIKQLGLSEHIFPGATHTRYLHSIGVMSIGTRVFEKLFAPFHGRREYPRLKETFRLACLLHDLGHAPLSHFTESAMPPLEDLEIPKDYLPSFSPRQATHEDYTIKALAQGRFSQSLGGVEGAYGVDRQALAHLISGAPLLQDYFVLGGVNYFPLLHGLVSGELDCDRMDYLLRDSYFCGVNYGRYDLDWLIDNLEICHEGDQAYLGVSERALITLADFLLGRLHMFVMVYFHYRPVCLEQLLLKYFRTSPDEYQIPADIDEYLQYDDHHLMKALRQSSNPYAQSVLKNKIPPKIYESFNPSQLQNLEKIQRALEQEQLDFIRCDSRGQFSKHDRGPLLDSLSSIKAVRSLYPHRKKIFSSLQESTDIFQKFNEEYVINRLHVDLSTITRKGRERILSLIESLH